MNANLQIRFRADRRKADRDLLQLSRDTTRLAHELATRCGHLPARGTLAASLNMARGIVDVAVLPSMLRPKFQRREVRP